MTSSSRTSPSTVDATLSYASHGLPAFPLQPGKKKPATSHGHKDATLDPDQIREWWSVRHKNAGVGIASGAALPDSGYLLVVDVDEHEGKPSGGEALYDLEQLHGKLPATPTVLTPSGGRHFYVRTSTPFGCANLLPDGIDIKGAGGYAVAHPTPGYHWEEGASLDDIPIADAPDWLLAYLQPANTSKKATQAASPSVWDTAAHHSPGDRYDAGHRIEHELERRGWTFVAGTAGGDGITYTRPGKTPAEGPSATVFPARNIVHIHTTSVPGLTAGNSYGPSRLIAALDYRGDYRAALEAVGALDRPATEPVTTHGKFLDGAAFILDGSVELEARWGRGSEVLWQHGESALLVAPTGVGKTTVAGQVVRGLVGLDANVLGLPVMPATKVLYLAMDRPRQIRRSMHRQFREHERTTLTDRIIFREGPLPTDLAKDPGQLVELATTNGCDVVIVDSLKDAAVKLTDDETGGNVNRAIQHCNAAGIDVLVLHHQRKGDGTHKPNTIADVYGSTWIAAGAGSVILLWGEAGGELVELYHLKQPADPVGPWKLEHNHIDGTTKIAHGFDALAFLRNRGETGATITEAAQAENGAPPKPGTKEWKRAERRLRRLVKDGLATSSTQDRSSGGTFSTTRYYHAENRGHDRGQGVSSSTVDTPWTHRGQIQEPPGQTVDATVDTP